MTSIPRQSRLTRVLVVEDSPLFAEFLTETLEAEPQIQVVGTAGNGREAVTMAQRLRPDVITMDVNMPVMDGLEAIERIMASVPTPILVLTADERGPTGQLSFEALRRGAVELMLKPMSFPASDQDAAELRDRIKLLASIPVVRHIAGRHRDATPQLETIGLAGVPGLVVGIVASTGGPAVLARIFERLPEDFPAGILVVQHLAPGFAPTLADWLNRASRLTVQIATDGMVIKPGTVLIGPDAHHLTLTVSGHVSLRPGGTVGGHCPSGTRLLESLASSVGQRGVGVVLTGMGSDGAAGLAKLRQAGGTTFVQDAASSVVYGMPQAALDLAAAQSVVTPDELPTKLIEAVSNTHCAR